MVGNELQQLRNRPIREIMQTAFERHIVIPAFNICYLPMVKPIVNAIKQMGSFGIVEVARPDVERFAAKSFYAVAEEFERCADRGFVRLHLDHAPVIDEEGQLVDWEQLIRGALALNFDSVMLDGSRLPLQENIEAVKRVVEMSHPRVAVEAELGAVLGHEAGPLPPYEELYRSGKGFTDIEEAVLFTRETGVDWLSVAAGNIHGAVIGAAKDRKKIEARLNIEQLGNIARSVGIPLVLHGGTGIKLSSVLDGIQNGITKINICTAIRQPYETALDQTNDISAAQLAVEEVVMQHIRDYRVEGSLKMLA